MMLLPKGSEKPNEAPTNVSAVAFSPHQLMAHELFKIPIEASMQWQRMR